MFINKIFKMFLIIVYCIIVAIFLLKPNSVKIHLHESNTTKFCDYYTGTWDGEDCICKYPEFITNNHYNGNCDKIVDVNCKRILNTNGEILNFNKKNPFTEGVCDCGYKYFYDILTRKCVLKRLNSPNVYGGREKTHCEDGYYYDLKYKTCLKRLCSWDILNPFEKIDQVTLSPNVCECDFISGHVPISLTDGTVGCTQAIKKGTWSKNHIIYLEKNQLSWKIFHLYPLTALTEQFKTRLDKKHILEDDIGTNMVAIEQIHGNWMDDLLSRGVTVDCVNDYKKYKKMLGFYDASTNKLTIQIKNE